jgi:hypothetical protein
MPASLSGPRAARACFAATALAALIGLTIQVALAASADHGRFPTAAGRVFNVLCYFTIQSNVLVCVGCLLLAIRLERSSAAFAWLRMTGLVAIVRHGYPVVLLNSAAIGALVLALAAAALRLDARLQRRAPQPSR